WARAPAPRVRGAEPARGHGALVERRQVLGAHRARPRPVLWAPLRVHGEEGSGDHMTSEPAVSNEIDAAADDAPAEASADARGTPDQPTRQISEERSIGAFRKVPRTGVIYVMGEAGRLGYRHGGEPAEDGWCNLGQGQPETGPLPGSP